MVEKRPWGEYEILLETQDCKVKKITVKPDQRLSYQYHLKRSETWVVVAGVLTVVLDEMTYDLHPGDSIDIPVDSRHRAWNRNTEDTQFIEVQTGTYFGEDDIIRLEDDYNRK